MRSCGQRPKAVNASCGAVSKPSPMRVVVARDSIPSADDGPTTAYVTYRIRVQFALGTHCTTRSRVVYTIRSSLSTVRSDVPIYYRKAYYGAMYFVRVVHRFPVMNINSWWEFRAFPIIQTKLTKFAFDTKLIKYNIREHSELVPWSILIVYIFAPDAKIWVIDTQRLCMVTVLIRFGFHPGARDLTVLNRKRPSRCTRSETRRKVPQTGVFSAPCSCTCYVVIKQLLSR